MKPASLGIEAYIIFSIYFLEKNTHLELTR